MTLAVLAAVVGLVTVLVALYRDRTVLDEAPALVLDWDPLPSTTDIARTEFPLAVPGYEPAAVDVAMDTLAHAYADLLAEAPPDVRARAYRRAAVRLGEDPTALPAHLGAGLPPGDVASPVLEQVDDPLEALRAAAALASLDRRARTVARRRDGQTRDGETGDGQTGDGEVAPEGGGPS
jgi:DivIVA domain-containing protein